jgi:Mrr N-terminal domain
MSTPDPARTPANANAVPVYQAYMNPILTALRSAGRPLLIEELEQRVLAHMALGAEVVAIPHDPAKPERSEVSYRMAWTRTYLKKAGLLSNPRIGTWALSDAGRTGGEVDTRKLSAEVARSYRGETDEGDDAGEVQSAVEHHLAESVTAGALLAGLRETHRELLVNGELLSREHVEQQQRRFREEFGPEVLARVDGEALLVKMHGRGTKDSLVYWLEFKNDAEFGGQFGGIGGGTALKFGMYQAAESGAWMTGTSRGVDVLSADKAISRARSQRDQLVRGVEVLDTYAKDPMGRDFLALQGEMQRVAPDLAESSWGHKYFSLIVPAVIGPFHGFDYQNYQLIKLLRSSGGGRYENAGLFLEVGVPLGLTLYELGATLLHRHGTPHAYWRVGTTEGAHSEWERMRDGGFAAVGWATLGDLTATEHDKVSKDHVRERMQAQYPTQAGTVTSAANQVFAFVTRAKERDLVLAMEGMTVRGIGRIQGTTSFTRGMDHSLTGAPSNG